MTIGQSIIDEIIKQGMFSVTHPDPSAVHVFVWSSGAAEQLDAVVANSPDIVIRDRLISLYSEALNRLGAPDGGDPMELLEWAQQKGPNES